MWRFLAVWIFAAAFLIAAAQEAQPLEPIEFWTWQATAADLLQDYQMVGENQRVVVRRFSSGAETYQALLASLKSGRAPDAVRLEYAFLPLLQHQNAVLD